jgi:phenylacetate-coenzyme A ligase PaaK-like adenylate-forming protein
MRDFGSTVIACTPSYAAFLGESIAKENIDPSEIKLRVGFLVPNHGQKNCAPRYKSYCVLKLMIFTD